MNPDIVWGRLYPSVVGELVALYRWFGSSVAPPAARHLYAVCCANHIDTHVRAIVKKWHKRTAGDLAAGGVRMDQASARSGGGESSGGESGCVAQYGWAAEAIAPAELVRKGWLSEHAGPASPASSDCDDDDDDKAMEE